MLLKWQGTKVKYLKMYKSRMKTKQWQTELFKPLHHTVGQM
jgi:hypothetical protein